MRLGLTAALILLTAKECQVLSICALVKGLSLTTRNYRMSMVSTQKAPGETALWVTVHCTVCQLDLIVCIVAKETSFSNQLLPVL
jgi:hypothetical protein